MLMIAGESSANLEVLRPPMARPSARFIREDSADPS
jgi:hypothetical protein